MALIDKCEKCGRRGRYGRNESEEICAQCEGPTKDNDSPDTSEQNSN